MYQNTNMKISNLSDISIKAEEKKRERHVTRNKRNQEKRTRAKKINSRIKKCVAPLCLWTFVVK